MKIHLQNYHKFHPKRQQQQYLWLSPSRKGVAQWHRDQRQGYICTITKHKKATHSSKWDASSLPDIFPSERYALDTQ
eukprot:4013370-Ditylum_brightwellii.AAC.1